MMRAIRGWTVAFRADPFAVPPAEALTSESDGAVVISGGRIVETGPATEVLARHPGVPVESYPGKLIMAGFVDCHIHYPQYHVIASYGAQLIDWLNTYTFPAELAFGDPEHAARIADLFLDEVLSNGTTAVSAYCTVHPQSAEALFQAAAKRQMAIAAGKVMMDRNAPPGLLDTAQSGYDESKALLRRWHGNGRTRYAISPRFAPTSTPGQLEAAGTLWREHPDALMQTHLSENRNEIAWVKRLFPDREDYFSVYEHFGLAGPGAIFGHAIHLEPNEIVALRASGSAIAHCPTSNTFIGSGLFDMAGLRQDLHIPVGLATDVGGGSSFSMFATMKAAYEIGQLRGVALHPAQLFWLATLGSAKAMRMETIGNLAPGYDADIVVIDIKSRSLLAERVGRARDLAEVLFAQIILADDRAIHAVYVHGEKLISKERKGL